MSASPSPRIPIHRLQSSPAPSLLAANDRRWVWDGEQLIKPIWEVIQPTHWLSFSSSKNRELTDLVNLAGKILYDLAKRYPGMRFLVIGSTNHGTKRPHLHGFLYVPPEYRVLIRRLLRSWKRGWKDLQVFDSERDAIDYVVSQIEEGEILWHDGKAPEPIRFPYRPRVVKATPARVGRERRQFNENLRTIEQKDRLERHIRCERERERARRAQGRGANISAPLVNLVVSLVGLRPLELPFKCPSDIPAELAHATPITWSELIQNLNGGGWRLTTVTWTGGQLGLTPNAVREWLGLRKTVGSRAGELGSTSGQQLVVNDHRKLALILPPHDLEIIPAREPGGCWHLRVSTWSAEVYFRSSVLTDPEAAQEVARNGMKLLVSRRGLGLALGSRAAARGDARVHGSNPV